MSNLLKRARIDLEDPTDVTRHPDLWFKDGSIVLKVQKTLFKVHQSLLSSHSTIFADMLGVPQPPDQNTIEGCPLVEVPDDAADFAYLLKAIYDPKYIAVFMGDNNAIPFNELAGVLRLSTKYDIGGLRQRSIRHLKSLYPSDFDKFNEPFPTSNWANLASALLLCRECNVLESLPFIYYKITEGKIDAMVPLIAHLPKHEWQTCFLGREKLLDAQKVVFRFVFEPKPAENCSTVTRCDTQGALVLRTASSKQYHRRQQIFHNSPLLLAKAEGWYCANCFSAYKSAHEAAIKKVWEDLPAYFGLGTWEELRSSNMVE